MLKQELGNLEKPLPKKKKKKGQVEVIDEEPAAYEEDAKPKKKKKTLGKKVPKKPPMDTISKFYESPHLQSIEDSYLKLLEA